MIYVDEKCLVILRATWVERDIYVYLLAKLEDYRFYFCIFVCLPTDSRMDCRFFHLFSPLFRIKTCIRSVVNSVLLKCRKLRREDQETSDSIVGFFIEKPQCDGRLQSSKNLI